MSTTTKTATVLQGTRFGTIEFEAEDVITFEEGLVGLPDYRRFVIVNHGVNSPFRWLQALDEPAFAMLAVEPHAYVADYSPAIGKEDLAALDLSSDSPKLLFVTASIPAGKPREMTVNLAGPVVINPANRKAAQIVLSLDSYNTRHRVFPDAFSETSQPGEAA